MKTITHHFSQLNLTIEEVFNPEYWKDKKVKHESYFQVRINNTPQVELGIVYFDLESAVLGGLTYRSTNCVIKTKYLVDAMRKMLDYPMQELTNIIKIDGDELSDGEVIDTIIKNFNLDLK